MDESFKTIKACSYQPGASGLGKSTLVNSMFLTDIYAAGKEGGNQCDKDIDTIDIDAGKDVAGNNQQDVDGSEQTLRVETHNR